MFRRRAATPRTPRSDYACSFCGQRQEHVRRLIAGPGDVCICDECIELCVEIIDEEGAAGLSRLVRSEEEGRMEVSARNQPRGTVRDVTLGDVMAEVVVDVGGQEVVSVITRSSAERLGIRPGEQVVVLIKSTEVMLGK